MDGRARVATVKESQEPISTVEPPSWFPRDDWEEPRFGLWYVVAYIDGVPAYDCQKGAVPVWLNVFRSYEDALAYCRSTMLRDGYLIAGASLEEALGIARASVGAEGVRLLTFAAENNAWTIEREWKL
jgi:hypothetical protein